MEILNIKFLICQINFQDIFNGIFGLIDHKINESMMITIATPSYYVQLTKLLNETPKRTIGNLFVALLLITLTT